MDAMDSRLQTTQMLAGFAACQDSNTLTYTRQKALAGGDPGYSLDQEQFRVQLLQAHRQSDSNYEARQTCCITGKTSRQESLD